MVTPLSLPLLFFCLCVGVGVGECLGRMAVGDPVREHIRVRACPSVGLSVGSRPYGRRYLGRMAVGLSPRGVASFYTLGRGLR